MSRIFWDTNLFIYLFESTPVLSDRVHEIARRMQERGDRLFTSAMAVGEIMVRPERTGRSDIAAEYLRRFQSPEIDVLPFDLEAAHHYSLIRRDRTIRPQDAIHLACAAAGRIDLFLTNDKALSRKAVPGIGFVTALDDAPL